MGLQNDSTSNQTFTQQTVAGYTVGQSATDLVGFYGTTPVAQRTSGNQAAVATTIATTTTPAGFSTLTQANAIVTLVNELRAAMVASGLIKGS